MAMVKLTMVTVWVLVLMPLLLQAADIHHLRLLASRSHASCILVFGDSSVDPGNNDFIATPLKSNFLPYGENFFHGRPTGRFTDGRLSTDFIAEAFGYASAVPAFIDPEVKPFDILHGVSFASAGSGYDDLTANLSNVWPFSKQLQYFMHYKIHLRKLVGVVKAEKIVNNAVFALSMGTNDFLQNYYIEPIRPKQFTLEEYQDYLASRMFQDVKMLHRQGARRLIVVGVPPLGCMPLVKTLMNQNTCVESYNKVSSSFNSKIKQKLSILKTTLGMKSAFFDVYNIMQDAINNPEKYNLSETTKGCCGTGTYEYGDTCKGMTTCPDPSKYVFWDAVHPTQRMYQIIANKGLQSPDVEYLLS